MGIYALKQSFRTAYPLKDAFFKPLTVKQSNKVCTLCH